MKKSVLVTALFLVASALPVRAEGAFAVAIPEGGFGNGFAYGLATNYATNELARQGAMEECRKQAQRFDIPASRCEVISAFRKQCMSIAFDRTARWVGWAVADTRELAVANAIKKCAEGAPNCQTSGSDCDQ